MPTRQDLIQLNDAHTASAAAYLKNLSDFANTKTVLALHNLGSSYQGRFSSDCLSDFMWKNMDFFKPMGSGELGGEINLLKLGMTHADATITVSRKYVEEILTQEQGEGLHGVLRV